jgi:4-hydroxy-tetrahydrodipicolinate reductase
VIFSGAAELLTIRSDVTSRDAYRQGILLACQRVMTLRGLHVGLDALL